MRNLLLFLNRYNAFFLFLLLEVFCFYLIVNYNHFQRTQFLSSSGVLSASVLNAKSGVTDYFSLGKQNEQLAAQNSVLLDKLYNKEKVRYIYTADTTERDSSEVRKLYDFIPAKIINKSTLKLHNYLTINKGENQGLKPQMGVMGPNGAVGLIQKTSKNYSTVMTLLHKESRISAILKNNNHFGSLTWDGRNEFYAQLNDIPTNIKVAKNDTVVTSGFSDFFPANIMIGLVDSIWREPGSNFHTINVELSTIFRSIDHVYIIDFIDREEIEILESETINE